MVRGSVAEVSCKMDMMHVEEHEGSAMRYTSTQDLEVTDVARLYEEAKARLINDERELSPDLPADLAVIEHLIGTPRDPDVRACLEVLLDPDETPPDPEGHAPH
jgi:hypothetical protein